MMGPPLSAGEGATGPPSTRGRWPATLALIVYLGVFWVLILLPFDFKPPRFHRGEAAPAAAAGDEIEPRALAVSLSKTLGHSALFLPLAPLLAWWAAVPGRRLLAPPAVLLVIALAAVSEISQLTVSRGTSWSDFAMDLLGYAAGVWLTIAFETQRGMRRIVRAAASPRIVLPALGALSAVALVLLLPARGLLFGPRDLEEWDASYPFLVGNEPTWSRPWHGAIERFDVFDRALEPSQVIDPPAGPVPLLGYRFDTESVSVGADGKVEEARGIAGPVLRARPGSEIAADAGGGIELRGARSLLQGSDAAAIEAIKKSGEVSIHARFRTHDLGQHGPARIVSCSINNARRNFTLGQDGATLELRVRTPITGPNGSAHTLRVDGALSGERVVDALATYRRGELKLYIDGVLEGRLRLCLLGWLVFTVLGVGLTLPVASGIAFLGWAAAFALLWIALERLAPSRPHRILLAALVAVALVLVVAGVAAAT